MRVPVAAPSPIAIILGGACCLVFLLAGFSLLVVFLRGQRTYPGK